VSKLASVLNRSRSPRVGDCLVCTQPVREVDDRMRLHGRHVHTRCAGYSVRRRASRVRGARPAGDSFTGD
jgi:hypothetical protein